MGIGEVFWKNAEYAVVSQKVFVRKTRFFSNFQTITPNFLILGQNWPTFGSKIHQIAKLNSAKISSRENFFP